jgi:hypothetical protein
VSVLKIDYESDGFATLPSGPGTLQTSWDDLLSAALTVGRPNRQYVFQYGEASKYEALFRLSLIRMALEQAAPSARRLRRTAAAKALDPTEKGAVNYFVGMTICKLFASTLLDVPWVLHLDVFRSQLGAVLSGRSRPDLVGQAANGGWLAMECKGRISAPSAEAKNKAKQQAQRVVSINGVAPFVSVAGISYLSGEVLRFYWRDPAPDGPRRNSIEIKSTDTDLRHCYALVLALLRSNQANQRVDETRLTATIPEADIEVGMALPVFRAASSGLWTRVRSAARQATDGHQEPMTAKRSWDGVMVKAGESWRRRFSEIEAIG